MKQAEQCEGYLYLGIEDPRVAWGVYRGVIISAATSNQAALSLRAATLLEEAGRIRLANEELIENARQEIMPKAVSRLKGLFAFPDLASAERAVSWGGHFDPSNRALVSVEGRSVEIHFDANWITNAPLDAEGRINTGETEWLTAYWTGEPYPNQQPIWEMIIDGRITISGTEIRKRAYDMVRETWPSSLTLLEIARLAAHLGSDMGHISALMFDQDHQFKFDYMMDMRDAEDPAFLDALAKHLSEVPDEVNWEDLHQFRESGTFGNTPDLTLYSFAIEK